MADINNKPKLQLRSGLSFNGEKTPSPATKLLINHGKPNFTIQRSPKIFHGNGVDVKDNGNPWTSSSELTSSVSSAPAIPAEVKYSDEFVVKSTTFNGVFKPSNISKASQQSLQQNGQENNEASKVVLRRPKIAPEPAIKQGEDENVPEFIRRQRRIQERLAKENVLDFENRRSGYFTQVMISPSSPNRQSFVETMSSPAIVPGLEIPPPQATQREVDIQEKPEEEESKHEEVAVAASEAFKSEDLVTAVPVALNGHADEEEVNRAIEEVNKAVAGEDDDKASGEEFTHHEEATIVAVKTEEHVEDAKPKEISAETTPVEPTTVESLPVHAVVTATLQENVEVSNAVGQQNGNHDTEITSSPVQIHVTSETSEVHQQNGHAETTESKDAKANVVNQDSNQNGNHSNGHVADNEITISHTNALSGGPTLPSPDPSGEKGVNYEPKTVVSFSQELGSDINKYPDTVKVSTEAQSSEELKELAKLKFEIKSDQQDIEVTPVLKTE